MGDQSKKILCSQVINPGERRLWGGDHVLSVGIVKITELQGGNLLSNFILPRKGLIARYPLPGVGAQAPGGTGVKSLGTVAKSPAETGCFPFGSMPGGRPADHQFTPEIAPRKIGRAS